MYLRIDGGPALLVRHHGLGQVHPRPADPPQPLEPRPPGPALHAARPRRRRVSSRLGVSASAVDVGPELDLFELAVRPSGPSTAASTTSCATRRSSTHRPRWSSSPAWSTSSAPTSTPSACSPTSAVASSRAPPASSSWPTSARSSRSRPGAGAAPAPRRTPASSTGAQVYDGDVVVVGDTERRRRGRPTSSSAVATGRPARRAGPPPARPASRPPATGAEATMTTPRRPAPRRWTVLAVAAAIGLVSVTGCSGPDDSPPPAAPSEPALVPGFDGAAIHVGVMFPASGPLSETAAERAFGLRAYLDYATTELAGAGGRYAIQVEVRDSADLDDLDQEYAELRDTHRPPRAGRRPGRARAAPPRARGRRRPGRGQCARRRVRPQREPAPRRGADRDGGGQRTGMGARSERGQGRPRARVLGGPGRVRDRRLAGRGGARRRAPRRRPARHRRGAPHRLGAERRCAGRSTGCGPAAARP